MRKLTCVASVNKKDPGHKGGCTVASKMLVLFMSLSLLGANRVAESALLCWCLLWGASSDICGFWWQVFIREGLLELSNVSAVMRTTTSTTTELTRKSRVVG